MPDDGAMSMMRKLLVVFVVAACSTKSKPPPPRPELIETIRSFADRVCACGTDRDCVKPIRDEFDAQKADLLDNGLTGDARAKFEAELLRLRLCGDGAGLTIWLH
jgi:hypothetical protein